MLNFNKTSFPVMQALIGTQFFQSQRKRDGIRLDVISFIEKCSDFKASGAFNRNIG